MGKLASEIGVAITAAALIATGIGAAAGAGLLGAEAAAVAGTAGALTIGGVSVSTIALIGTSFSVLGALTTAPPKLNGAGSPQSFKADPYAPIPFVMARFSAAG